MPNTVLIIVNPLFFVFDIVWKYLVFRNVKIKKYIRDSLKKNLGNEYNGITVENLLLEIFYIRLTFFYLDQT